MARVIHGRALKKGLEKFNAEKEMAYAFPKKHKVKRGDIFCLSAEEEKNQYAVFGVVVHVDENNETETAEEHDLPPDHVLIFLIVLDDRIRNELLNELLSEALSNDGVGEKIFALFNTVKRQGQKGAFEDDQARFLCKALYQLFEEQNPPVPAFLLGNLFVKKFTTFLHAVGHFTQLAGEDNEKENDEIV